MENLYVVGRNLNQNSIRENCMKMMLKIEILSDPAFPSLLYIQRI
jgi:hypothetical protein